MMTQLILELKQLEAFIKKKKKKERKIRWSRFSFVAFLCLLRVSLAFVVAPTLIHSVV